MTTYIEVSHDPPRTGRGIFPLCEVCWQKLGHPEARIEYYGKLVGTWGSDALSFAELKALSEAVASGR